MERLNAQLDALLRDFAGRSLTDSHRAAQLRAAVEANELTVRTLNAAAVAGAIRSFEVANDRFGANGIGTFDPVRGSVSIPASAFHGGHSGPVPDLVAICRVQSMLVSFSSGVASGGRERGLGPSAEMIANLQNTLNESPTLASEIRRAATTRDSASPRHFGLERLELLPFNANLGGAYVGSTHTMLLPSDALIRRPGTPFRAAGLTFVLGHEVQHSFNRADALRAIVALNAGVDRISRAASPIHDYTSVLADYLGEVRKDEARGQIAGWNAVQSRLETSGRSVTIKAMVEADDRMRDFVSIDFTRGTAKIHPDIVLNADMTMSPTTGNLEAMGKHYFDRPVRDHIPQGSNERTIGLNHDHVSNYPNHYGKLAIEQILAAEERAPLFRGMKPEVTIDMARLGLFEDVLERQGLDLTRSHGSGQYFDSTQLPSAPRHFDHTVDGKDEHRYVPVAPSTSPEPAMRLDNVAHPDHALFNEVRRHVVELDRRLGRTPDHYTDNISSALAVQARAEGIGRVDRIELSDDGNTMRAMRDPLRRTHSSAGLSTSVPTDVANTPMEQSAAKWPEAIQRFHAHEQKREARRALPLNDPRNPESRDHSLYSELQGYLPDASEDRLLQFTAACHRHRIKAGRLCSVHVDHNSKTVTFDSNDLMAVTAVVGLSTPPPAPEQSIQQIQQFDQQMEQISQQSRDRSAQMAQQGPVM